MRGSPSGHFLSIMDLVDTLFMTSEFDHFKTSLKKDSFLFMWVPLYNDISFCKNSTRVYDQRKRVQCYWR